MADDCAVTVYNNNAISDPNNSNKNTFSIKVVVAQMLRNGAIVQVTNVDEAKIAESAGVCCIIVSEKVKKFGSGISRMLDPAVVKQIQCYVAIPIISSTNIISNSVGGRRWDGLQPVEQVGREIFKTRHKQTFGQ
ncbi:hypothetical protein QVD17_39475 [Tagetes erecta]|uniref:PdxS/SNZ N-terminal domain-containing protein n=1 Tax=Tagetes erecta TaxID=13708 RepID=A0AAD8JQM0_TARER|nr:hypothetical protein QVD17_39475 [Tagetes erecta]